MLKGLIGKKIGMTQIFDETGAAVPVTLIEAGPCYVTQVRLPEQEGYAAVQLGFSEGNSKRLTSGELGHLKKNNLPPLRFLREFRVKDSGLKPGDKLTVEVFGVGERVDVVGTSKGKGFAGVVKRYHFAGGGAAHGSMFHRAPGSIGASSYPSRVVKGMRMGGHMGHERVTVRKLKVVATDKDQNLLIVKGAVPGAKGGYLLVRKAAPAAK